MLKTQLWQQNGASNFYCRDFLIHIEPTIILIPAFYVDFSNICIILGLI